jgi:NADPH:quinone reductase-like Zn-dependent oxidoreductase
MRRPPKRLCRFTPTMACSCRQTTPRRSAKPPCVKPTTRWPLDNLAQQIAAGALHIQIGKVFHLDEIAEAHHCMEENKAGGKIVVLT